MEKVEAQTEPLQAPKIPKKTTKQFISSDEAWHKIKSKLLSTIGLTDISNAVWYRNHQKQYKTLDGTVNWLSAAILNSHSKLQI